MKLWIWMFLLYVDVSLSRVTIKKAQLFQNTLRRWNVDFERLSSSDKLERYQRFSECFESVNRNTKDIILHSLNNFCVMNNKEFAPVLAMFRGYNLTQVFQNQEYQVDPDRPQLRHKRDLPATFDYWEKEVGLTPPGNQLGCGSCWSFPTVGAFEPLYKVLTGDPVKFSQQYFVNCNGLGDGCSGGDTKDGYKLVEENQFIFSLDDYPYKGTYTECPQDKKDMIAKNEKNAFSKAYMAKFYKITSDSDTYMEKLNISPIAFGTYPSSDLYSYSGGTYVDESCTTNSFGHAMLIVGYDKKTWRVKASWGTKWGDKGYVNYDRFADNIIQCDFFNSGFVVQIIERKEVEYEWCNGGKLSNYYTCKNSCEELNDAENKRTGWTLAIIPTRMHNERLLTKITDKYGPFNKNAEDKYKFFWFGARDLNQDGVPEWIDGSDYVFSYKPTDLGKKFGLLSRKDGSWLFKSSTTYQARGFCSRYVNCFDFSMKIAHAAVTYDTDTLEEGTVASIKCQDGTTLVGSSKLTCLGGGKWSDDLPTCSGTFSVCKYEGQAILDVNPVPVNRTVDYVCGGVEWTASCNTNGIFVPGIPDTCKNETTTKNCRNIYSDMVIYPPNPSYTNGTTVRVQCQDESGKLSEAFEARCNDDVFDPDLEETCAEILNGASCFGSCFAALLLVFWLSLFRSVY